MTRLNNIPKKTVFKIPDGYFERLPAEIQSRISTTAEDGDFTIWRRFGLHYALPAVVALGAVILYFIPSKTDAEALLSSVETADLILYVQETSLTATSEELLEDLDLSTIEMEAIENEVYDLPLEQAGDELFEMELNNL